MTFDFVDELVAENPELNELVERALADRGRTKIVPLELADANDLVRRLHRHHRPVQGHRFSIGAVCRGELVGAAIVGRPVARLVNQREVLEVTRLVTDGTKNACSALYAAAARVGREMGYRKIQTYILEEELGTSLKAAGWAFEDVAGGGDWNKPSRGGRRTDQPQQKKQRWSKTLAENKSGAAS